MATTGRTISTGGSRQAGDLLAGGVARQLGVGVQTLHYYEREGLIPPPERSRGNYRMYSPALVERVRFIRKAQALGLPLNEIKDILRLAAEGTSPCGRVQTALAEKLAEVDERLRRLREFREELATLVADAPALSTHRGSGDLCAIVEEAMPLTALSLVKTPLARAGQRRAKGARGQAASHGR